MTTPTASAMKMAEGTSAINRRTTTEQLVPGLRWYARYKHSPPVLQQYVSITTYENGVAIGLHGEWRDVPHELEEALGK